jgi:hypothetical protein
LWTNPLAYELAEHVRLQPQATEFAGRRKVDEVVELIPADLVREDAVGDRCGEVSAASPPCIQVVECERDSQ